MLYETAVSSGERLTLNVEDLNLAKRRARIRRKGIAIHVVIWAERNRSLLLHMLKGHKFGPAFGTGQRARV